MIRRVAITLLAVIIAAFRLMRRRKQVSAREIVENRLSVIAERIREAGDDAHCRAVRDAQAAWARDQERIDAASVIAVVQGARSTIVHAGAAEARAVLDDLQRVAAAHPEGLPGHIVADARLKFDALMRKTIQ
jgi:hypothetical protein